MSCSTTSATRSSRSDLAAVSTAVRAAASHDWLLVPISSVTRYTLSAMATSFKSPPGSGEVKLFSRSQQVRELFQLALATQLRPLRPVVVVHRVECQHHPHAVLDLAELDHRLDLVGLDAGNEIGDVLVDETARRVDLLHHHPPHRAERAPPPPHAPHP